MSGTLRASSTPWLGRETSSSPATSNEGEEGRAHRSIAGRYRVVSPGAATFPTSRPERVIDIVFASPDLVVRPGGPVDLDEADLRAASDHRPVWVEVVARPLES